ncbi:polysaccharide pyruvyl transferase family protein [Hallerella porci]|uniref:Polysaccharide pyruvyl transferase n=1 Tax=Hallerella porci TaxID=1945871 RepID=A0ABX5LNN8_9BACT|nr:polysaccharide pyruvyl transferase family protein [Hallerella porci]PWK92654.1 polysaccharide pyruvyl transferase [Hallerella porci]
MKVGILTFHFAHNYGAVLQCFALQKYLQNRGHEVFIIDYAKRCLVDYYAWWNYKRIIRKNFLKGVREIFLLPFRKKRFTSFESFQKKIFKLATPEKVDCFVIGSDQVWNTNITVGFDDMYWGNAPCQRGKNVFSYAASMGDALTKIDKNIVASHLKNFKKISVREYDLAQELLLCSGQSEIDLVPDPTLLLTEDEWSNLADAPLKKDSYILVYQVRASIKVKKIAEAVSRQLGKKIIYLSPDLAMKNSCVSLTSSPENFLGLIKNAAFVVTSSFHGTVFSILFKKQFLCVKLNDGCDARSLTLLESVDLKDHFVESFQIMPTCDWNVVNEKLNQLKEKSLSFFEKCDL